MLNTPRILPVKKDPVESVIPVVGLPLRKRKKAIFSKKSKNRRKNKIDRRRSVRDGVFVSFSFTKERRRKVERRSVSNSF